MQANRMIRVAQDFVADYDNLKIDEFMREAVNLAGTKGGPDPAQYANRSQVLKSAARKIISGSIFNLYPQDLKNIIASSAYAAAMPERLATIVLNGFPTDSNLSISSTELQTLFQFSNVARGELTAIARAAKKFNIEPVVIPEGLFSIDILLPRNAFDNEAQKLIGYLERFIKVVSDFAELVTGKYEPPLLVYESTSEPVTAIATVGKAAYAVFKLYKSILEVADKQVSFLKTLKDLRAVTPPPPEAATLETLFKKLIADELPKIAESAINSVQAKVAQERTNELTSSIALNMPKMLEAVAKGGRLSITIEGLDRLNLLLEGPPPTDGEETITEEMLVQDIKDRSALESKLEAETRALDNDFKLLLPVENIKDGGLG